MKKILLLNLILLSHLTFAEFKIYTEDTPPLNYLKDGKPEGFAVALVEELKKRINDNSPIEFVSWARGYNEATTIPNVLLFSTTRTVQRENVFRWVGPIAEKQWIFVQRKNSKFKIKNLDDAKLVRSIGVYKEDSKEQYLIAHEFKNIDASINDDQNINKLIEGRIDLWMTGKENLKQFFLKSKDKEIQKKISTAYVIEKKQLYLAFSKETSDEIFMKWEKAFEQINKDGTFKKIRKKYASDLE